MCWSILAYAVHYGSFINTDLLFMISSFTDFWISFYIKFKFKNLYFNTDILGINILSALEITFIGLMTDLHNKENK